MYSAVLILALAGNADLGCTNAGCSARASCHQSTATTTRTIVTTTTTTTTCTTARTGCTAAPSCSNNAGCSARPGLIAAHHQRVADRAQVRADKHQERADRRTSCGAGGVTVVIQAGPTPAQPLTPPPMNGEKIPEPKQLP